MLLSKTAVQNHLQMLTSNLHHRPAATKKIFKKSHANKCKSEIRDTYLIRLIGAQLTKKEQIDKGKVLLSRQACT